VAVVAACRELTGDHDPVRPVGTAQVGIAYDACWRRAFDAARRAMALASEAHLAYAPSVEAPRIASSHEPAPRLEI
jgi:hypothetical protein